MAVINPDIFREYDIRGIYGTDLTEEYVELIGKAYGTLIKRNNGKTVSTGRDCRLSSPSLSESLINGITSTGINVINIGIVSTPILYFSLFNMEVDGGVMLTASHNPGDYNGVKLSIGRDSLYGEGIQGLRKMIEADDFEEGSGEVKDQSITTEYIKFMKGSVHIRPGLKVAVDCGNGMVGLVGPQILKDMGFDLVELYSEPDGTFPNHHPDPTVEENLVDLQKAVIENKSEVGIAFDGDGDRLGVIDENGNIIWGDMLVLIYALSVLEKNKGATIIGDVKCSSNLFKGIEEAGGKAIMWKTGHSLIKSKIKETNAELAGEMSGHMFFNDRFYGYDDAFYAALRLLEIISKSGKKVSELLAHVPKTYSTPEIRVECDDATKFQLVETVTNKFRKDYDVIDIDGVRVNFPDGWGLIRASNTQPALVLRFEAESEARLSEIRNLIESKLEEAKLELSS